MATNLDDVMRALGRLEEGQRNANESRRVMHDKIDAGAEVSRQIAGDLKETAWTLKTTTEIAIQARDRIAAFEERFEKEAAPILEGVKSFRDEAEPLLKTSRTIRNIAGIFAAIAGTGIVSFVGILVFANEAAKAAMRAWLGI